MPEPGPWQRGAGYQVGTEKGGPWWPEHAVDTLVTSLPGTQPPGPADRLMALLLAVSASLQPHAEELVIGFQ